MKGIRNVHLRAESGCAACTDWSGMKKVTVQHIAFLVGCSSDKCQKLWTSKCSESTDTRGKAAGETPCQSSLQMSLHQSCETQTMPEAHGNVSEEMKYCFRCATQLQAIFFDLVLLVWLLAATLFDLWISLHLPKADWHTSCFPLLQNINTPCSYPLGIVWDSKAWREQSRAKK